MNSYITNTLMKTIEWDKYTKDFGFVSVSSALFIGIIEAADDDKLNAIAHRLGPPSSFKNSLSLFTKNLTQKRSLILWNCYFGIVGWQNTKLKLKKTNTR